jgi:drug/metabolite transporter (DMT)-like permease
MTGIRRTMGPVEWAMLSALSLIWGGSFLFNALALRGFSPITITALRVSIGAACLWLVILAMGYAVPRDPRVWFNFLVMGIINNAIPFTLIVWGQQYITLGLAAILTATTPLFAVVVANQVLPDEKLSINRLAGVIVGLFGVVLIVGLGEVSIARQHLWGELAVLGAAISYAFASVWGRKFAQIPSMVTAAGQVTASSLVMAPLALWNNVPWRGPPPEPIAWAAAAGLGILSTALAYGLFFVVLRRSGATNIVLVTLLVVPSAMLLGAIFLGEAISARDMAGLLVIGAGLALIDGRLLRLLVMGGRRF